MGLASARNSAVTALNTQSTNISISADNIANADTPGFKSVVASASTLVTDSGASTGFSSGGVTNQSKRLVEKQGLIESTGRVSDLAVSGNGFFAIRDESGTVLLSRDGSFDVNSSGELVNSSGFNLMGWPLDNDGRKPGEEGNVNTTASESIESLEPVDINSANGTASSTSTVAVGMNLDASETTFQGATVTILFDSTENSTISESDIILPADGMMAGESFSLTSDSLTSTFEYGGYSTSHDITESSIFGVSSTGTIFSTASTGLTNGDKFTITTATAGTVTFTFSLSSPDANTGEFNSMESLVNAIDSQVGLSANLNGGEVLVSSSDAREAITFSDLVSSNLHNELGFGNVVATSANRFNTLSGLETIIQGETQLGASIISPTSGASMDIFSIDPLQTLTLSKLSNTTRVNLQSDENAANASTDIIVPPRNHAGTIVNAMGIDTSALVLKDGAAIPNALTVTYGGIAESTNALTVAAPILGATTTTADFSTGVTNNHRMLVSVFSAVTATLAVSVHTYTFVTTGSPTAASGEFDSLATLASTIEVDTGLTARVVNDRIYIASTDADQRLQFSDLDATAFVSAIGLSTVAGSGAADRRFASVTELQSIIDGNADFSASALVDPTGGTSFTFSASAADSTAELVIDAAGSADDLVRELGLAETGGSAATGGVGDAFFEELGLDVNINASDTPTAAGLPPSDVVSVSYDPTDATKNISGGNITSDFSRNVRIFDALGTGHDFRLAYLKVGTNQWSLEIFSLNPIEISGRSDGLIASGTIAFNGDGSLASVPTVFTNPIDVTWATSGSSQTSFTFDLGTAGVPAGTTGASSIGLTDGLRQFDASYNVEFVEQNGVSAGQFNGIEIGEDGTVNARFSNGEVKAIFKLPVVTVPNQNALQAKSGNVFSVTQNSGELNLQNAGAGGAGVFVPGALEGSTSDIAEELTEIIGIQSNYAAGATIIQAVRDMEEQLINRVG
jgi:flagellar hook-basal body protein